MRIKQAKYETAFVRKANQTSANMELTPKAYGNATSSRYQYEIMAISVYCFDADGGSSAAYTHI